MCFLQYITKFGIIQRFLGKLTVKITKAYLIYILIYFIMQLQNTV